MAHKHTRSRPPAEVRHRSQVPMPAVEAVEQRLLDGLSPALLAPRQLERRDPRPPPRLIRLRPRLLTRPVIVAIMVSVVWRRVPSIAEVQQVCDSATIIGHGRMLASGRVEELIGTSTTYRVVVADPAAGARLLQSAGHVDRVEGPVLVVDTPGPPEAITKALADGGVYLAELVPVRADLESVFLQLTEESTLGHGQDLGAQEAVR